MDLMKKIFRINPRNLNNEGCSWNKGDPSALDAENHTLVHLIFSLVTGEKTSQDVYFLLFFLSSFIFDFSWIRRLITDSEYEILRVKFKYRMPKSQQVMRFSQIHLNGRVDAIQSHLFQKSCYRVHSLPLNLYWFLMSFQGCRSHTTHISDGWIAYQLSFGHLWTEHGRRLYLWCNVMHCLNILLMTRSWRIRHGGYLLFEMLAKFMKFGMTHFWSSTMTLTYFNLVTPTALIIISMSFCLWVSSFCTWKKLS